MAPVIGNVVQVFCSTLISGLISCSLLIFLDRSKQMNRVIKLLNMIPSEVNNYEQIAAISSIACVGTGIYGGSKMKEANDTMKIAKEKQELQILKSFDKFSDIIEKFQGCPEFKAYSVNRVNLFEYKAEELKNISTGAGLLLGGIIFGVIGSKLLI